MAKIIGNQIALSSMSSAETGNLLRPDANGLFMALAAEVNVQNQYVSSSMGSDSNDGTVNSPLKTLEYAMSRLPDNTTGNIFLYETDTFPVRALGAPQTWGASTGSFGYVLSSGLRNISIWPYGPQTNNLDAAFTGTIDKTGWMVRDRPRPILEIGHYMFQGRPVGTALIAGSDAGQNCAFYAIEFRFTDGMRAACANTGRGWAAGGYAEVLPSSNGSYRGCIFPSPIVIGGNTVTRIVGCYNQVDLWNTYIPVETSIWISVNGCTNINVSDSGANITDRNGTSYPVLSNTCATNIGSRIAGVVKDSNGVTRNVFSNIDI